MDDAELAKECGKLIWLSAYANNNAHSAFHWQADATFDECRRRGKSYLYEKSYQQVLRQEGLA